MTRVVFVFLFLVFVTVCSQEIGSDEDEDDLDCDDNEEEDPCPSRCFKDKCPTKEPVHKPCRLKGCDLPTCKCRFNMKRAPNGTCIDTRHCPPFKCNRPNEEYVACPPYCPTDKCAQASPDGLCPITGFILVAECQPTCRCIKGYWRKNGKCVPYSECNVPVTSAPPVYFGK